MNWFVRLITLNWPRAVCYAPISIYIKYKYFQDQRIRNHESIHWMQQKEMLYVPFYLWYVIEFIFRFLFIDGLGAYRNLLFEQEAFDNDDNLDYLKTRKKYAWIFKPKLYGKLLFFKKGQRISLFLTFKCNLKCNYCSLLFSTGGKWPQSEISSVKEWKDFLKGLKDPIKEITLTGGEPTLYPGFVDLVNWLLEKGYFVKVYSNLTKPEPFFGIKQSFRFIIHASYHKSFRAKKFIKNYNLLRYHHRVDVYELGKRRLGIKTKLRPVLKKRELSKDLIFAPDRILYANCDEMCITKTS